MPEPLPSVATPVPLQIGRRLFEWGSRTYIMGVLNVTPDSFSGDGIMDVVKPVARGRLLAAEGADILDVGGESTRPGARPVPLAEELRRVIPVVEALAGELDIPISVDTMKAEVARQALRAGAAMINDVSALGDPGTAAVVAAARVPVILLHGYQRPAPTTSQPMDVVDQAKAFLSERIRAAVAAGILRERILVDPGFGFGKTIEQNLEVLRRLSEIRSFGRPVVIGPSRKGTIGRVLGGPPVDERLEGTAAAVAVSVMHGADIVRVHDVRAMARVAKMTDAIVRPQQIK